MPGMGCFIVIGPEGHVKLVIPQTVRSFFVSQPCQLQLMLRLFIGQEHDNIRAVRSLFPPDFPQVQSFFVKFNYTTI